MSLGYISRVFQQAGMRVMQGIKDQASKCDSNLTSLKDSPPLSSSSKQAWCLPNALNSTEAFKAAHNDRLKQAEESLRTVMFLSCWGPN